MAQDDDIEKLFAWLQMPDLHYRDFAGGREVSDAYGPWQTRREYVEGEVRTVEEGIVPAGTFEAHPVPPPESAPTESTPSRRSRRPTMIAPESPAAAADPGGEPPTHPAETEQEGDRPLNQVFDRLGPGRERLPDPRDRLRNIPGLGPPRGRSR
jgi:hypothetical protein